MSFSNLLLSDFALFSSEVLTAPPKGEPFEVPAHFERWADVLARHKRTLFMSSRGLGKTLCLSYAYPIWKAARDPGSICSIVTSSDPNAKKRIRVIKRAIEKNPKLRSLLPDKASRKSDSWSSNLLRLRNGSEIEAFGFTSQVRGGHPNLLILDDVLDDKSLYSDLVRRKSIQTFRGAIEPMLEPTGEIRLIGTPLTSTDLYAHIQKDQSYHTVITPAIRLKPGQRLEEGVPEWPERYSMQYLLDRRNFGEGGELNFAREYMVQPIGDLASLFPSQLFESSWQDYRLGLPGDFWRDRGIVHIVTGVDFARSAEQKADDTAIVTFGIDEVGNHWILDVRKFHGMPYSAQLDEIKLVYARYRSDIIALEKNSMQSLFADGLVDTDLPIVQIQTGTEKHSLDEGIPSLRILFERAKMRFPRDEPLALELAAQLQAFAFVEGKVISTAKHDDAALAWLHGERAARKYIGFSFGTGADDDDIESDEEWLELQEDLQGASSDDESYDGANIDEDGFDAEGNPIGQASRAGWGPDGIWRESPRVLAEERRRLESPQPINLFRF